MPRVFPPFIACVFYIYPSEQDANDNSEDGATGFFYGERSEVSPNFPHLYAVTNRHVVFRDGMEEPVLRINTKGEGYKTYKTDRNNWIGHPDGDDIAIYPIYLDLSLYEIDFLSEELLLRMSSSRDSMLARVMTWLWLGGFGHMQVKEKIFQP